MAPTLRRFTPPAAKFLAPHERRTLRLVDGIRVIAPPEGLGFAPAVVPGVVKAAGVVKSVFQKSDPQKDANRVNQDREAERLAMSGNVVAAAYVRQRTGQYGTKALPPIPGVLPSGGNVGGWGSDKGKSEARAAWQRILTGAPQVAAAAQAGNFGPTGILVPDMAPSSAVPAVTTATPAVAPAPSTIERIARDVQAAADTAGQIAQQFLPTTPAPTLPVMPQPPAPVLTEASVGGGSDLVKYAIAGGLGYAAVKALAGSRSRPRRRRR